MKFQRHILIGHRDVGGESPCLIIAEAGIAHFGDIALARDLVDLAADSGADVFKTQIFDVDVLISKTALDWRERLRPRNLTFDQVQEIKDRCESRGLIFMATAHDESRVSWLEKLNVEGIKVGSGEKNNPSFIESLACLGKPMIVSTGMCDEVDVKSMLDACARGGCDSVALMHCVTSYPVPTDQINLAAIDSMRSFFSGPVGYSDHSTDGIAVLAAVARGADIVERHITILRNVPNAQDWKVSSGPEDFPELVKNIRVIEGMIGDGIKASAPCEAQGKEWALKSLVAARDLPAGHVLAAGDLAAKRPGLGIPPSRQDELMGRRLKTDVAAGELINKDQLAAG
jgi:N,N'-diacetyllegionaminate synthase